MEALGQFSWPPRPGTAATSPSIDRAAQHLPISRPLLLPSLRTLVMTQDCLPISGSFTGSHLHSPFGHVRSLPGPGDQRVDAFGGRSSANRNGCATVSHCCHDHVRGRGGGGRPLHRPCAHSGCLPLHVNTSFRGSRYKRERQEEVYLADVRGQQLHDPEGRYELQKDPNTSYGEKQITQEES